MNKKFNLLFFAFSFFTISAFAQITLPRLISDGMILQRDTDVKLWGWASSNEEIRLQLNDETFQTTANSNGDWEIILPPQKTGGPYEMVFEGKNRVVIDDVLFGDVWLASGQSNMELMMERVKEQYPDVIAQAENPNIRQFLVPDLYDFKKEHEDLESGAWVRSTPESVLNFSAVAYFFAMELYEEYQVPIGIINAALGGSPVEAWMSEKTLKAFPKSYEELQKFKDDELIARIESEDQYRNNAWYENLNTTDEGLKANPNWYQSELDDSGWKETPIPGYWNNETIGDFDGSVWFRNEIEVPDSWSGKEAFMWLGTIVDQDSVFINGEFVGTTGYQYPPRRYPIDKNILKAGKNEIAVRVINSSGTGGFIPDKPYFITVDEDTIDLKGLWKYKIGTKVEPLAGQTFVRWKPAGLYNRMIAPLTNYNLKGVIWYQGESNTGNPESYAKTFPTMIESWREQWRQPELPFLFVQLANFMESYDRPTESNWAALRQAQLNTLSLKNTGLVVIIDLGEWNDIHPLNKKDVGHRLYLEAKKEAYGEANIPASPVPGKTEFKEDLVLITFEHAENGLMTNDGSSPRYFAISSDGKNFVWAETEISGNTMKVWNNEIKYPVTVRYAWADNPGNVNMYNEAGLPMSPFEVKKENE